jgi:hypothetical protein
LRRRDPHVPIFVAAFDGKEPGGHREHGSARDGCVAQPFVEPRAIEMPAMAVRIAQEISLCRIELPPD